MANLKRKTEDYNQFGLLLDALCREKGMSFHQLAEKSGLKSHASIVRACQKNRKSRPSRENILAFCRVLECSIEQRAQLLHALEYAAPEDLE